jgi:hypothetical protein
MKVYRGMEVYIHEFLTSALDGSEWSASRPGRFPPRENPRYLLDRGLGGPQSQSGHGGEGKNSQPLPGLKPPNHPARSPALYQWAMPAPIFI